MSKRFSTLLELRRRRVFRGIGFYLVGAWTLLQVAEVIAEPAGLPGWTLTALLYVAVVGFPLAVWVAWRYELTDHGLVRTRPATAEETEADYSLKSSDYVIFVALLAIVSVVAWQGLSGIRSDANEVQMAAEQAAEAEREAVENSVAVLPFSDLSQNADQGFLGDGIADTVLHVLSQVKGLTVSARTSSFAFRNRDLTVEEIARELGVEHVLEGSVQRAGDQLRVIARLIDARNSREMWSGNFDRTPEQIFAVQDEIAREVVAALQGAVLEDDRERIEDEYQPVLEAYEQYVIGRREMDAGTADSVARAMQRFETAIEIDPDYAQAYAALGKAVNFEGSINRRDPIATTERIDELAEQAIDLDPTLAEAWTLKGGVYATRKEFDKAGEATERALELNPNSAEAWAGQWNHLLLMNKQEEALAAIRKATELDPESVQYQSSLAMQLFQLSRAEEAIYVLRETIRRHPGNPGLYIALSRYLTQVGKAGEAMWYLQTIRRRDPENMGIFQMVCLQYWQLWDNPSALACFDEYIEAVPGDLEGQLLRAAIAGEFDEAARIAGRKVEQQPDHWYAKMQLADHLARVGDWEGIIETVSAAFPGLMGDEPEINDWNQWGARRLAGALLRTGQSEQANLLIDATLTHFERSRKLQAGGWMAGPDDALLHALRGEVELALDSLERAIVRDWMFYAQALINDPALDKLRDNSRFIDLVDRLGQNVSREREWYENNKDRVQL